MYNRKVLLQWSPEEAWIGVRWEPGNLLVQLIPFLTVRFRWWWVCPECDCRARSKDEHQCGPVLDLSK